MSSCARTTTAALIVALCATVAPVASAAPIRACANKKTGALRVVSGRKHCKRSERKLSWNLAGKNGAAGATGAQGQQGPKGDTGSQGPQGVQGLPGASLIGAPAGGALTGFFPDPLIALDAVSGPQVLDNSLTGADIDESTLGKVPNSDLLDGIDSTGFLAATGKAADSNLLDGIDSTGFLPVAGKAADSNLLDGVDSTGFLREIASGSNALDLSSIASLGCSSAQLGSATAHGLFVLVNNPYDALAGITSGTPSLLDVSAVRIPNGTGDDIWLKVCNLNPLNVINPSNATFDWALVG